MSSLQRNRKGEPVSRDQILMRELGQHFSLNGENIYFPCLALVGPYSATCNDDTCIHIIHR